MLASIDPLVDGASERMRERAAHANERPSRAEIALAEKIRVTFSTFFLFSQAQVPPLPIICFIFRRTARVMQWCSLKRPRIQGVRNMAKKAAKKKGKKKAGKKAKKKAR